MTIRETITSSGVPTIDAEILLCAVLKKPRSWLVTHDHEALQTKEAAAFQSAVLRRRTGEPVAYITKEKEFYGRPFRVSPAVLIPRPATETLVEEALRFIEQPEARIVEADTGVSIVSYSLSPAKPVTILDIGTGSGVIAITIKKEGWKGEVLAIDTSRSALEIAKENAVRHAVREEIQFRESDGAAVIAAFRKPFLVVSNPPYIPSGTMLEKTVHDFEPHMSLFAGSEGLDVLTEIVQAAKNNPACCGIILELQTDQISQVQKFLA